MSHTQISRRLVVAVALVAGFVSCALSPSGAEARVPTGPRLDSLSVGCGQLQDEYDRAVRDLTNAGQSGTQAQYDAAFANLKRIIGLWRSSPCEAGFGSLIFRKIPGYHATGVNAQGGKPTLATGKNPGKQPVTGNIKPVVKKTGKVPSVLKQK